MTVTEFEISHSIELEINLNGNKTTLLTSVEHILDDTVLLTPILMNGKIVGFPPPISVNLYYVDEGQVFLWSDVTVKAVKYQNKAYHSVTLENAPKVLNRRGAYRVFIGQKMNLVTFSPEGSNLHEVFIRDISETGMSFFSEEEFSKGRTVRLYLKIKGGEELSLSAQVVWKRQGTHRRKNQFLYGCKFIGRNRQLTSYLMTVQQERQKKRMGL